MLSRQHRRIRNRNHRRGRRNKKQRRITWVVEVASRPMEEGIMRRRPHWLLLRSCRSCSRSRQSQLMSQSCARTKTLEVRVTRWVAKPAVNRQRQVASHSTRWPPVRRIFKWSTTRNWQCYTTFRDLKVPKSKTEQAYWVLAKARRAVLTKIDRVLVRMATRVYCSFNRFRLFEHTGLSFR